MLSNHTVVVVVVVAVVVVVDTRGEEGDSVLFECHVG